MRSVGRGWVRALKLEGRPKSGWVHLQRLHAMPSSMLSSRLGRIFAFSVAVCLSSAAIAYTRDYNENSGYLTDVSSERDMAMQDMVVIAPPSTSDPIKNRIFDPKITKEFEDQYNQRFGFTESERSYYATNKYTTFNDGFGDPQSVQDVTKSSQRFGEYMVRRLAEYHSQQFAQHDPSMKAVWNAKERYSKMDVDVSSFKFSSGYDLSSNTVDLKLKHAWIDSRMQVQMKGVGGMRESIFSLSHEFSRHVTLESHYTFVDGIAQIIARKQLTPSMSASLVGSTFTNATGSSTRETLYLAGWGLIF